MIIGAQLYTVREQCKTPEALAETLARVAEIGYTSVQLSGICAYEPDWMADQLKKNGLTADITHFDYGRIINDTENTIRFHDTIGCKYIGIGSNPRGIDPQGLEKMAGEVRPALAKIIASGHKFMYHNHNMEFARFDGKTFLDLLCETFTPEECGVTLDTYWVMAGGADPAAWLRKLKGRVDCVHFKDMVYAPEDHAVRMAPIGQGNMNYAEILKACEDANVRYGYVEQDNCYGEDPVACLRQSYEWFRAQGLY